MKRLEELAEAHGLPSGAAARLLAILDELASETSSISAVRERRRAVDVHVADSLSGLAVSELRGATSIADLGSGGGFPALVLAVALPRAAVTAIESVGRKCEFIRRAAQAAGLANVEVVNARAECWPAGIGSHDVITARALAPLNVLVEYAAPLLRPQGVLVAYKGRRDSDEEGTGAAAAELVGLSPRMILEVEPYADSGIRHLHVFEKARRTPDRFPRRAGMARKRPLGEA